MKSLRVYRNLHKGNFSIQSYVQEKSGYRVTDRVSSAIFEDCTFRVYESGRKKVLRDRSKNVHAYVEPKSYRHIKGDVDTTNLREIYYNPYEHESFVYRDTMKKVVSISRILTYNNKLYDVSKVLV